MRASIVTAVLALSSSLAFCLAIGCSADAQHSDAEGDAPGTVQADALSKLGKSIVGDYQSDAVYPRFSLAADGTYTWDTGIRCVKAPCPSGDAGKWTIYNGTAGRHYVNLVSKPAGEDRWFRIYDGPPVVLKGVFGTDGTFTKQGGTTGPSCATVRCAAGYTCQVSGGTVGCVALPKDFCNTDGDCKLVDDYCGGCNCLPLASWAAPPSCTTPVSCFVEPCRGKTVACESNHCVAR